MNRRSSEVTVSDSEIRSRYMIRMLKLTAEDIFPLRRYVDTFLNHRLIDCYHCRPSLECLIAGPVYATELANRLDSGHMTPDEKSAVVNIYSSVEQAIRYWNKRFNPNPPANKAKEQATSTTKNSLQSCSKGVPATVSKRKASEVGALTIPQVKRQLVKSAISLNKVSKKQTPQPTVSVNQGKLQDTEVPLGGHPRRY